MSPLLRRKIGQAGKLRSGWRSQPPIIATTAGAAAVLPWSATERASRCPGVERVAVAAPMSFAGSAQRLAKLPGSVTSPYLRAIAWALTVVLIVTVWMFVLAWYSMWGLWLLPYRIIRRGQRKQKVERLRHREMIEQLDRRP